MPGIVIIGSQWGDEGKGKVTDLLADEMDMVVRYQGGNNAGHTIVCGEDVLKLHLVPSGILYPHITPVIGNGVVVNPKVLLEEMEDLEGRGIDTSRLRISSSAHVILPCHETLDRLSEEQHGGTKLGTTHRGIGPAYADKALRQGIRMQDMLDISMFREKLTKLISFKSRAMTAVYGADPLALDDIVPRYIEYAEKLKPYITDTSLLVKRAISEGENVLLEGAQGTMLDLDHGTYPYVTSSSPTAGGACTGSGIGPFDLSDIIGVTKAYVTRVGLGPFPTEQENEVGEAMQQVGQEFGTTTGRKRRCGWFDLVVLRYSVRVNSMTAIAMTKLDVLSQFDTLQICTGYRCGREVIDEVPADQNRFAACEPVYQELPGWKSDIGGATTWEELPDAARDYLEFIQREAGIPIRIISVGPERTQTILFGEGRKLGRSKLIYRDDLPI
ncbi:MAG: adenylosuccinate synthase [Candidatus Geothermincolia bacterium]